MCPGYNTVVVRVARAKLRTDTQADAVSATVADHLAVNYSFPKPSRFCRGVRHIALVPLQLPIAHARANLMCYKLCAST